MANIIAYRRVSTSHLAQETTRQLFNTGIEFTHEFEDKQSGKSALKRHEFQKMLDLATKGDTIHIQSNDRVFRNTREMLGFVEDMMAKQVTVKLHSENLEFNAHGDPMQMATSKMMLTNLASFSEYFLAQNKCAINQGIAAAKAKGIRSGRASKNYGSNTGSGTRNIDAVIAERKQVALDTTAYVIPEVKKAVKYLGRRPTQAKVATFLNDMNVFNPRGKKWTQSSLQRVLSRHEINIFGGN